MSNIMAAYNPDVLSCLANLSNDEVFTPPEIVNQMLAILQQEDAVPEVEGYHWKIEPLMNRNGYYSSGGWWIETTEE